MDQNSNSNKNLASPAESTAVTKPTVVSGLGYPNGREEVSPSPVGWQPADSEVTIIEKQVSRETSR